MSYKNRIGHVVRPGVDVASFVRSNDPTAWLKHARTLRRGARVLHSAYQENERRIRAELGRPRPGKVVSPGGTFVETGTFKEGEDSPFMRMIENARDQGPMLMLAGLSIETALKALWIQRDPACIANGEARLGHTQIDLARNAEVTLSEAEQVLCLMLTDFVIFAGRYPTSSKAREAHVSMTIGDDIFAEFELMSDRLIELCVDRSKMIQRQST